METLLELTAALAHHLCSRVIGATASDVVVEHLIARLQQFPEFLYICVSHDQKTPDARISLRSFQRTLRVLECSPAEGVQ